MCECELCIGDEDGIGACSTPFDISGSAHEVSVRWKKYIRSFQYYATGKDISKRSESLLLHFAGPEVQDIFETLPDLPAVPDGGAARSEFKTARGKLDKYFAHEPNTAFERHSFRRMTQLEGETVAQFCQRLRQQGEFCSYLDKEDALMDQLVEAEMQRCRAEEEIVGQDRSDSSGS